jgi:hypothetical protein
MVCGNFERERDEGREGQVSRYLNFATFSKELLVFALHSGEDTSVKRLLEIGG